MNLRQAEILLIEESRNSTFIKMPTLFHERQLVQVGNWIISSWITSFQIEFGSLLTSWKTVWDPCIDIAWWIHTRNINIDQSIFGKLQKNLTRNIVLVLFSVFRWMKLVNFLIFSRIWMCSIPNKSQDPHFRSDHFSCSLADCSTWELNKKFISHWYFNSTLKPSSKYFIPLV